MKFFGDCFRKIKRKKIEGPGSLNLHAFHPKAEMYLLILAGLLAWLAMSTFPCAEGGQWY